MKKSKQFRAGAAISNLTPPLGVSLDGPISQNGVATHVHDELSARCLALDDGDSQLVFVICDSTMISSTLFDQAKHLAHGQTGLPMDRMLAAATHTHSSPRLIGIGRGEADVFYLEYVVMRIADGIRRALNNLAPAKIGWGSVDKPEHVFNRRWKMKPLSIPPNPFGEQTDQVRMNPPAGNPNLLEPAGPVDPQVSFLSVRHADGRPMALLANYGLHYVGGTSRGHISADYFGVFANRIGQLLDAEHLDPPFVGVLSNGTSGDVNNINFREKRRRYLPYAKMRAVAHDVAGAVAGALKQVEHRDSITLDSREALVELGVRTPSSADIKWAKKVMAGSGGKDRLSRPEVYARETLMMKDWKKKIRTPVQAFRVGAVGIAAMPCEVFAQTGLEIKRDSPLEPTFTIELANAACGYLPTVEQHRLGGYETWRARSSFLEVEAEPKLRKKVLELLGAVARSE